MRLILVVLGTKIFDVGPEPNKRPSALITGNKRTDEKFEGLTLGLFVSCAANWACKGYVSVPARRRLSSPDGRPAHCARTNERHLQVGLDLFQGPNLSLHHVEEARRRHRAMGDRRRLGLGSRSSLRTFSFFSLALSISHPIGTAAQQHIGRTARTLNF